MRFFAKAVGMGLVFILFLGIFPRTCVQGQPEAAPKDRDGLFITVPVVINEENNNKIKARVKKAIEKEQRRIETIVFDFNPNGQPAGSSSFSASSDLAQYIRELRGLSRNEIPLAFPKVRTVAFVHNEVSKHTVLPVLACYEIVMSDRIKPNSNEYLTRLGDVLRGQEVQTLPQDRRIAYETAAKDFYPNEDLIFRMIDPNLELVKVTDAGKTFFAKRNRAQLLKAQNENLLIEEKIPAGLERGRTMIDYKTARDSGLTKATFNTRHELAHFLKLPRQSMSEDWVDTPQPARFDVRGVLDKGRLESLKRRISRAVGSGVNLIFLQLETEGGETRHIPSLAQWLRDLKDSNDIPIKTVAYIPPGRSLGSLTFLALACQEIVMSKDASLGDFSYLKDEDLKTTRQMLATLAKEQGYPEKLFEATLDRDLILYHVRSTLDRSEEKVISRQELEEDKKSKNPRWTAEGQINDPGKLFKLDARLARDWRVAQVTGVETVNDLYALYGITDAQKVRVDRGDWLEDVADFFRKPVVCFLLIMVGIIGLILELKMPGVGIPGIIAAICFVLFFWSYSFVGEFFLLAIFLFILGLILLAIEIFILPGFGVTGLSGIILVVTSLILVTLEKMPETSQDWWGLTTTLGTFALSVAVAIVIAFTLGYYLPSIPYANRLVLAPPSDEENGPELGVGSGLLGAIGLAATQLRPAGKARFGDDFFDVVTEGDFVESGRQVQVIEIEGNKIVVKEV